MRDVAIAHKDYDVRGGGEILAERMAEELNCPLFVGHGNSENQPEDSSAEIHEIAPESRWHRLMQRGGLPRAIAHMMHWRDNAPEELGSYNTIITSGNEPLWFMPRDEQTLIAYTHSTPRFMYDLYHTSDGFIGRTYQQLQRILYESNVRRPDLWIVNSDLVARRINLYWNIPQSQIRTIYPPVPTEKYSPTDAPTSEYYLYLGRLAGHKEVDMLIEAFNKLDKPLVIAGRGPKEKELQAAAGPNISFEGFVSEAQKQRLYAEAKALVYPCRNEDFGMVPIECMAAGTPVLGVHEGFTQYQIQDGKNGSLWTRSVPNLRNAIRSFEQHGIEWSATEIATWAKLNFGVERFADQMEHVVSQAEQATTVTTDWTHPQTEAAKADGGNVE